MIAKNAGDRLQVFDNQEIRDEVIKRTHRKAIDLIDIATVEQKLGFFAGCTYSKVAFTYAEKEAVVLFFKLESVKRRLHKDQNKLTLAKGENYELKLRTQVMEEQLKLDKQVIIPKLDRILRRLGEDGPDYSGIKTLPPKPDSDEDSSFSVSPFSSVTVIKTDEKENKIKQSSAPQHSKVDTHISEADQQRLLASMSAYLTPASPKDKKKQ